jgi:hypothetical protein
VLMKRGELGQGRKLEAARCRCGGGVAHAYFIAKRRVPGWGGGFPYPRQYLPSLWLAAG